MFDLQLLRAAVGLCLCGVLSRVIHAIAQLPVPERPRGGFRGQQRRRSFSPHSFTERVLRVGGNAVLHATRAVGRTSPHLQSWLSRLERWQLRQIVWAGSPWGLSVHEAFFLMGLLGFLGLGFGLMVADHFQTQMWIFPCAVLGASLLSIRLRSLASERLLLLSHGFPSVIDLAALSMNAGSDLVSALSKIAERQEGVVKDELNQLLAAFEMGVTRRAALLAFEERCPIDEVHDLVRAVIMAEQKGASVATALSQQAQTSRQRRSVRAEESAARAGVLLVVPMMLLMGCVLILLVGPLFLRGGGF